MYSDGQPELLDVYTYEVVLKSGESDLIVWTDHYPSLTQGRYRSRLTQLEIEAAEGNADEYGDFVAAVGIRYEAGEPEAEVVAIEVYRNSFEVAEPSRLPTDRELFAIVNLDGTVTRP